MKIKHTSDFMFIILCNNLGEIKFITPKTDVHKEMLVSSNVESIHWHDKWYLPTSTTHSYFRWLQVTDKQH
jgi:hypothetical protein